MSKMVQQSRGDRSRESGMVSILITMVLMIVVTLIVLGLAQISRRNQRQVLDRQLSTQAFYAAETAVNDVRNLIKSNPGVDVPAKTDCTGGTGPAATYYSSIGAGSVLDAANNVQYTCVIVDPTPPTLVYSSIGTTSTVLPIASTTTNITSIKVVWQSKDATSTPTLNCPNTATSVFSATSSWTCGFGVIRIDLVPTSGSLTTAGLQSSLRTVFLVPQGSGGGNTLSTGSWSNRYGVQCADDATACTVNITGLNSAQYHMRISSLYKDSAVQISATDSLGAALDLKNAQAMIDSTGKAQDVLRRIQVRVPIQSSKNQLSDYAIQSNDSLCKRFIVMDNYFDSAVNGVTSSNPLCQP